MWRLFNRVIDLQISGGSTRGAPARVVILRLERWPPEEVAKEKRLNEARPRESLEVRISEFVASSEHCRILFRKDVSKCITEGSCTSSTIHFIDRNSRRRCVLHDKPDPIPTPSSQLQDSFLKPSTIFSANGLAEAGF
jgi:hypothetical protein